MPVNLAKNPRHTAITRRHDGGLQGMPSTTTPYAGRVQLAANPPVHLVDMSPSTLAELLAALLLIPQGEARTDGRTVHAEYPTPGGLFYWTFTPLN
ncbi:hypothetical protein [Streptomyces sp. NPDC047315]|uniref:hypothetical protein n=1 Tax=Streptomyces sp. NPDC047315 TaxID=3155142 RepID=UPI0033F7D3FB